jgi:hypothetical protein
MADLTYPKALSSADWLSQVGDADKYKGAIALKKLETLFQEIPFDLFKVADIDSAREARERIDEVANQGVKACKAVSDLADAVGSNADKAATDLKKDPKATKALKVAQDASTAAAKLGKEVLALTGPALSALKTLAGKLEEQEKKTKAAAPPAKPAAAPHGPIKLDPKLATHNGKVKVLVGKLRAGKQPKTPFAFLQNKVKEPYKKGKLWAHKSLVHVGPKAIKSCRSELERLLLPEKTFAFFFGEVHLQLPDAKDKDKDKGKLIFMFETPLADSKKLKDALLFQCGYSPKMLLRTNKGETVEEAGEDEEEADKEEAEGGAAAAPAAAPARAPEPAGAAVDDAAIEQARKALVDAHTKLQTGIGSLVRHIGEVYKGTTGADRKAVDDAMAKLDTLKTKLHIDLGSQLAAITREKDPKQRARLKSTAKNTLAALTSVVVGDDLMADIDRNELLPNLVVVAPMKESLKKVIGALA